MRTRLRRLLRGPEPEPVLVELTDEDRRYLTTLHDDTTPLPPGAADELRGDSPRLAELRAAYDEVDLPVRVPSRWSAERVEGFLDLCFFRGETLITWHYRELPKISRLKYYLMLGYVRERDALGLLDRLDEDGAFGCWTFEYPGHPRVSRDLIESINEISFLERELHLSQREGLRVLDIGAGYGRLAHRMTAALPNVADYCCVDAIAESTFVCEFYLRHRNAPARVVPLHEVEQTLRPGQFDLAVNIHSFSECTLEAIEWWVQLLARLEVPNLLVIPNEPDELLSLESDGSRRDFAPAIERAGYTLRTREPVWNDPAVRELIDLHDQFHLFGRP
jgi:SAM-dependent methyltransferase